MLCLKENFKDLPDSSKTSFTSRTLLEILDILDIRSFWKSKKYLGNLRNILEI